MTTNSQTLKHRTFLGVLILSIVAGCAPIKQLPTPDQATAIEQFLITQAIELSLNKKDVTPVPLPPGETITLDTTHLTAEKRFFIGALGQWLGEQGLLLMSETKQANYRIQILAQALGTEQSLSFFGIPAIQSVVIPFALPEIALYKNQSQSGFTRFRLDIFENITGKFIRSTPWLEATTYYNEYTIFMFFSFHTTNLLGPLNDSNSQPAPANQEGEDPMDY
jgi:hypothetical protein